MLQHMFQDILSLNVNKMLFYTDQIYDDSALVPVLCRPEQERKKYACGV